MASRNIKRDAAERILAWYDRAGRTLPWRADRDPYRVWLSEIMLQQTTVAAVIPYYESFLARWPGVEDLAQAELNAVLNAWKGLGYYARARNLHACARVVAFEMGGRFPDTEDELRKLPGVGEYTAAAVAAIAFERPVVAIDANVARVASRLFAERDPKAAKALARGLAPDARPGDFVQALMDLGATVCKPKAPDCGNCPLNAPCAARARGEAEAYPPRKKKPPKPNRYGVAFWAERGGAVLVRRRPEKGLLGGMAEFPSTPWRETPWSEEEARREAPIAAEWRELPGAVRHGFTHFNLELKVWIGNARREHVKDGKWVGIGLLDGEALPTVMKKVASRVHEGLR